MNELLSDKSAEAPKEQEQKTVKSAKFSTLKKRLTISGNLIAFIAFLMVFDWFFGGVTGFYIILAVFSSFCFYEFAKLYGNININLPWHFPVMTGLCGLIILWMFLTFPKFIGLSKYADDLRFMMWDTPMLLTFTVFIIIAILYYLKRINDFHQILILCVGFAYVYIPIWSIARLRGWMPNGIILVLYFITMVKIGDSVAYFWGTRFGRHKLAEKISPNKTVEGFIAGLLGASIVGMVIFYLLLPWAMNMSNSGTSFWLIFIINLMIVFVAQLGDLFESYIKRTCQVKDSGNILGPMGGILDLSDSLLLAAPVAAFLLLQLY
ncbi:MAG TPA: CDP-archaeol synthase [Planctomycetota bacterium]|nr:CDP-archaeol synthase [Planctomycetota bacterium]